jgi:hypothetical protein
MKRIYVYTPGPGSSPEPTRAGSTFCDVCDRGQYQSEESQTTCIDCLIGRHIQDHKGNETLHDKAESCKVCWFGQYQPEVGKDRCIACAIGKYIGYAKHDATDDTAPPGSKEPAVAAQLRKETPTFTEFGQVGGPVWIVCLCVYVRSLGIAICGALKEHRDHVGLVRPVGTTIWRTASAAALGSSPRLRRRAGAAG